MATKETVTYATTNTASRRRSENNDCGVQALAIATNLDYDFIRGVCFAHGRETRKGTTSRISETVLHSLGYTMLEIHKSTLGGQTIRTVVRNLDKSSTFLIWTVQPHVLCVKRGKCEDWTAGSLQRVKRVARIIRPICVKCLARADGQYTMPPRDWDSLPDRMKEPMMSRYIGRDLGDKSTRNILCAQCAAAAWGCHEELLYRVRDATFRTTRV